MNKKQTSAKIFALIFMAALILPFGNIQAQEVQSGVLTVEQQVEERSATEPLETASVPEAPAQESSAIAVSSEVEIDQNIQAEDLGISDPKILADNTLYQVKSFWQGLRSALTFNPVKKAELKLQYANEKLIEAKKLAEIKNNPELAVKALEKYQNQISEVAKIVENASDKMKEKADNLTNKIIDYSFKQQKLIDNLEKKLDVQQGQIAQQAKNQGLEILGKTISGMIPVEQINNKINGVIDNQKGSEFKNFKNLEILKAVEQKVPETAREAIRQAQQNVLQKLETEINQSQEKEKFQNYVANIGGDETRHLEIIQEMVQKEIPQTIRQELNKAKEKIIERVEKKMQMLNEEQQKKFLAPLEGGSIENLRTLKELENNLSPEIANEILETKNKAIDNFRKNLELATTPEQQTAYLNKIEELSDVKQLGILEEVEKVLPQEEKNLLIQIKERVANRIKNEIKNTENEEQKNLVLEKITDASPEQMEIIKGSNLPLEVVNTVLNKQIEKIQEKIQNAENMENIQNLKEKIVKIENVKEELEKMAPEIMNLIENKIEEKGKELTSEKTKEQIEKLKNELDQVLGNENFEKLVDSTLIEIAKKRLNEAEAAFNQGDFGQAFGQATAGLHQIASLKKMIKEKELQQNMIQERIKQKEQKIEEKTEIPNPASQYCIKMGGIHELKGQYGICHLADGTDCEEWEFFRGNCPAENKDKQKEKRTVDCPALAPVSPDFCKDGKMISGGKDKNGCPLPPKCVKSEMEQIPIVEPSLPPASPAKPNLKTILPKESSSACIQVITPAIKDGVCREFPTPCDVPDGWQKVEKCEQSVDSKVQMEIPTTNSQQQQPQTQPLLRPEPVIQPESQLQPKIKSVMKPGGSLGEIPLIQKIKNLLK